MTDGQIKEMIHDGICKVQAQGGRIVDGRFNVDYKDNVYMLVEGDENCCALSAMMIGRSRKRSVVEDIITTIKRNRDWVWSFTTGFDGRSFDKVSEMEAVGVPEAYEMGVYFRNKLGIKNE